MRTLFHGSRVTVEQPELSVKRFPEMSEEWLDFIVACRSGRQQKQAKGKIL